MKKLDFPYPFAAFMELDFINCFACVYNHLEGKQEGEGGPFFLFDTMCGRSSIRFTFDGKPNEMQKWIGDVEDGSPASTDDTVNFLFGFAGYHYRICTDTDAYKDEITASINAGKPVIAKVKTGRGRFRVIIGYDGKKLLEASYESICHDRPKKAVKYGDIEALYIVGDKIQPRYTLLDGLRRIRQVMEYNAAHKPRGSYIENLDMGALEKVDSKEKQARMKRLAWTMWHMETYSFAEGLGSHIFDELQNPAFQELRKQIRDICYGICNYNWALIGLAECANWEHHAYKDGEVGLLVEMTLEKMQKDEDDVLDLVKQAIAILEQGEPV
jgi:hypothetical protein